MNAQYLEHARAAYRAGDYSAAVQMFNAAKDPSEVSGEVDHLRGNALMKLGLYRDAAVAYAQALNDASYGKRGALLTNQGKAYAASGDLEDAVQSFSDATRDASYATPYKAYLGLGQALLARGSYAEAGTAFRQAAIDTANPAPSSALAQLGACFVKLGRPGDAVESYRTALDFATPRDDTRSINAGLGQALAAAGRPADAVDAFMTATADGIYQLTPEQADDLARAQDQLAAASAQNAMAVSSTQGVPGGVDPLDPLGKSGAFMPDPSDTGFFTLSESELVEQDRKDMKVRRKRRHTGLKVFIVLIVLLLLAAGGLVFAYTRGLGFPSQQDALNGVFAANGDVDAAADYLDPNLSESAKSLVVSTVPDGASAQIDNMDQSMTESAALVTARLSSGGEVRYDVTFVRSSNHIGWAVSSIELHSNASVADGDSAGDSAPLDDATVDEGAADSDAASDEGASDASGGASADDASAADDAAAESNAA